MTPRITLDPGASALLEALRAAGHRAYAVGGCVRDSLLGKAPGGILPSTPWPIIRRKG